FLDLLEPGSAVYNIPAAILLDGRLHVPALAAALSEVVRRHEALRTTFSRAEGSGPVQIISAPSAFDLPVIDLQALPAALRDGEASRLSAAEARRPFDLAADALLRTLLLAREPERHTALFTMHHIVSDGWSMGVLVREVGALYTAFLAGRPSPLPELPVQYADFAAWQRRHLSGEHLDAELAWWRGRLADLPSALDLPVDHPRPATLSGRGDVYAFTIGGEIASGLAALTLRHGATLFMTLLAGFAALLHRLTAQDDLALATPIAGRIRMETEPLIGFFVNTLVLRIDLTSEPGFAALLDRVRETALAAFAHQEVPFERLVEELAPERDLSRPPLAQAMLAVQNAPSDALELPGLTLTAAEVTTGTAKFELSFTLTEMEQGLAGTIEYSSDLFEAATIARLAGHFSRLLESAIAAPDRRLAELPLLSEADTAELIAWSDGGALSAAESVTLHGLFEA